MLWPSPVLWIPALPAPVPSCAARSRVPRTEWGQALGQPCTGAGRGNDFKWLPWEEGCEAALRAQCWGTGPKSRCVGAGLAPRCPATLHPVLAGLSRAAGACAHGLMEGGSLHFSQDAAHRAAASVLGGSQQQQEPLRRGICPGMGCWSTFTPAPCLHHPGCWGGSSHGAAALSLIEGDFAPWALPAQPLSLQSRAGVCFSCGREAAEWAVGGGRDGGEGRGWCGWGAALTFSTTPGLQQALWAQGHLASPVRVVAVPWVQQGARDLPYDPPSSPAAPGAGGWSRGLPG